MANVRVCLWLFVLFVSYRLVNAESAYESAWCSFFCGDDDDDSGDDDYYDIFDIFGVCDGCSSSSSSSTTSTKPGAQQPVNIMLPPSNGLNLSISSSPSGSVLMNLMPWAAPAAAKPSKATTAAPAAPTTAAAGTTKAAATTKAPATTKKG